MKILLVEDDDAIIAVLIKSLAAHHYVVDVVKDGEMGWTYGSTFEYDLIVMELVLPKLDGICLCQRLRQEGYTTPILFLTSQNSITAKVQGLDAGADDYVVKPFDPAELTARIRALLRRGSPNLLPLLIWGDLLLNPGTCEVTYQNRPLVLTTKEYELLELLLRESQHVFSPEEILDRLWSSEEFPSEATVRSHIRRLRNKLTAAGAPQDFVATVHGRGYYLKAVGNDASAATRTPVLASNGNSAAFPSSASSDLEQQSCREPLPQLLVIDGQPQWLEALTIQATNARVCSHVQTLDSSNINGLTLLETLLALDRKPDILLVCLPDSAASNQTAPILQQVQAIARYFPDLPILMRGNPNELGDRLEAVRRGVDRFLPASASVEQTIASVLEWLERPKSFSLMVVDNDSAWLQTLPALLKPWGFRVTTLADPQEFWTALQAVAPDIVVLDIEMSPINGLELCQVLRSDPNWQHLPVLFLSKLTDAQTQAQSFAAGADDYLGKPITAEYLAQRLLNRLHRVRSCGLWGALSSQVQNYGSKPESQRLPL